MLDRLFGQPVTQTVPIVAFNLLRKSLERNSETSECVLEYCLRCLEVSRLQQKSGLTGRAAASQLQDERRLWAVTGVTTPCRQNAAIDLMAAESPMCMMPRRGGFVDQTLTTALISPKNSNILFEDKKGYSMALEYRSEMTLRVRLLLLLAVPFVALIGSVLISFFGVFSREAYELVASIFGGDMTRLGDFLGYILVMAFSVGVSSTLIIACLFTALVKQNYVVEIDADRRIVDVHFLRALPWQRYSRSSYQFDEIEAIELKYDVEETEILLRLPNRKRALRFTSEFRRSAAESKLRQFKEMGLPVK